MGYFSGGAAALIALHAALTSTHGVTTIQGAAHVAAHAALLTVHGGRVAQIAVGTYDGDDTQQNRAIPHTLSGTPMFVFIWDTGTPTRIFLYKAYGSGNVIHKREIGASTNCGVIAWDTTNFYVGGGAGIPVDTANGPYTYTWVAIGR